MLGYNKVKKSIIILFYSKATRWTSKRCPPTPNKPSLNIPPSATFFYIPTWILMPGHQGYTPAALVTPGCQCCHVEDPHAAFTMKCLPLSISDHRAIVTCILSAPYETPQGHSFYFVHSLCWISPLMTVILTQKGHLWAPVFWSSGSSLL